MWKIGIGEMKTGSKTIELSDIFSCHYLIIDLSTTYGPNIRGQIAIFPYPALCITFPGGQAP